jgi:hypothetical protein
MSLEEYEEWKALILAECGQEELDAKIRRGEPYQPSESD